MDLVSVDAVRQAAALLDGVLGPTPVEHSRAVGASAGGADVYLKCENLQRTGSFKLRGAYTRISRLPDEVQSRGVVCASAGNHAQGVALAASLLGVSATVFMPSQAPLPKIEATRSYGADVRFAGASVDDALAEAQDYADEHDVVLVHPFDHADVIAGQGTVGLELLDQVPDLRSVLVPVGGGGLISGIAVALRDAHPDVTIVGVQATGAASVAASQAAGTPIALDHVSTIADGIAIKRPGALNLAHIDALVDDVVTVDDDAIARAVVLLLERAKLLVEPSGAVGVAALLSGMVDLPEPIVAVLSGGNIDPLMLEHLIRSGLTAEGRYTTLRTRIPDEPGELAHLLAVVAEAGGNVVTVEHHRFSRRLTLGKVDVVLEVETRGHDHVDELLDVVESAGLRRPTVA